MSQVLMHFGQLDFATVIDFGVLVIALIQTHLTTLPLILYPTQQDGRFLGVGWGSLRAGRECD
jgi:hypothetical protein